MHLQLPSCARPALTPPLPPPSALSHTACYSSLNLPPACPPLPAAAFSEDTVGGEVFTLHVKVRLSWD